MVAVSSSFKSKQGIVQARIGLLGLTRYWAAIVEWRQRERLRRQLANLSNQDLRDIGMTRDDIDQVAFNHLFDARTFVSLP